MKIHPNSDELFRRIESLEKKIDDVSSKPVVRHYIALRLLRDDYLERLSMIEETEGDCR